MFKNQYAFLKYLFLFMFGGFAYGGLEILFRGYSHVSMFVAGGISFLFMGQLNEGRDIPLIRQMLYSALFITAIEFVIGLVVNVWLGLGVWDYSDQPFHIMGQVCLLFSIIWFFLSLIGIFLDDYIRYSLMDKKKPKYRMF